MAEGRIDDIPVNLRPFIAFLHEDIQIHISGTKGSEFEKTEVYNYLTKGLVQPFGVERIFNSVLLKATPKLPLNYEDPNSDLCKDILQWGLKLLLTSKVGLEDPKRFLGKLPAPCIDGWYPIEETSFGPVGQERAGIIYPFFLKLILPKVIKL